MKRAKTAKVLFQGPCDITAILTFLKPEGIVRQDVNATGTYCGWLSCNIVQGIVDPDFVTTHAPKGCLAHEGLLRGEFDLAVVSIIVEPFYSLYRLASGELFYAGPCHIDLTKNKNEQIDVKGGPLYPLPAEMVQDLLCAERIGEIPCDKVVENYKAIRTAIPKETKLCILLGPTFDSPFGEKNETFCLKSPTAYFKEMNQKIKNAFAGDSSVVFVDPNELNRQPRRLDNVFYHGFPSVLHYSRLTYLRMAKRIVRLSGGMVQISTREALKCYFRYHFPKLFHFLRRVIHKAKRK